MSKNFVLKFGAIALLGAVVGLVCLTADSAPPTAGSAGRGVAAKGTAPAAGKVAAPTAAKVSFSKQISPILTKYCVACHSGQTPAADRHLDFANEQAALKIVKTESDFWSRVETEVSTKQMPPSFAPKQPTDQERALLARWIDGNVPAASPTPDPTTLTVRRLNNQQYANTVRDLLYLPADYNAAEDFPPDERGDGFDNNAATLTISSSLIERYLAAVENATIRALDLDPKAPAEGRAATLFAKKKLNDPSASLRVDFADRQEKIRLNIETFAPRAFRRPVSKEEIEGLMKFAALSFAHAGESFDQATALAIRATLMSPEFLFRLERDPHPDGTGKAFEVTEYQLATRLSYFLWNTMPDDELFAAARDNKLRATLDEQIARMLKDPKSISLTKDFLGQWLEIRGMHDVTNTPKSMLDSMQGETEHFFDYIVRNDRSIMEFLNSDYTFVNAELAKLYGIPGITDDPSQKDKFQKVQVDPAQRGGIFTQASFLTLTSKPLGDSRRTSPVLRGKWILENIFAQTIPPPPPNVPQLDFDTNKQLTGTVRQIFEQHRADPNCASCHARMDPYGFALENYDGYGAWRKQDNHVDVDASGEIDGKKFGTPVEFRAIMLQRKDDFRRALVGKLLSYAMGRGIQSSDRPVIDAIDTAVKADGDRFSSIIANVVKSDPFQHARGMKGQMPEDVSATTWFKPPVPPPPPPPPLLTQRRVGFPRPAGASGAAGVRAAAGAAPAAAPVAPDKSSFSAPETAGDTN